MNDLHRHFCVLGKLCHLYDIASADESAMKLKTSKMWDQIADGAAGTYEVMDKLAPSQESLDAAILDTVEAATKIKTVAVNLAAKYLTSDACAGSLEWGVGEPQGPEDPNDPASVLICLKAVLDQAAATLTTESSTGLINFFESNWTIPAEPAWPQAADESATWKDSVYVVEDVVADEL